MQLCCDFYQLQHLETILTTSRIIKTVCLLLILLFHIVVHISTCSSSLTPHSQSGSPAEQKLELHLAILQYCIQKLNNNNTLKTHIYSKYCIILQHFDKTSLYC